jgi:predicted transcriptional regulator
VTVNENFDEEKVSSGVRVNLTKTELARLQKMAEVEDRSVSSVVRRAVREMFSRTDEEVPV